MTQGDNMEDYAAPRIKWPNFQKRLTEQQIREGYKLLQHYEKILQAWDSQLEDRESALNVWEKRLLAETESRCEEFENDFDHIDEMIAADPDCDIKQMSAADMKKLAQPKVKNEIHPSPAPLDAGTQKDINELERLYALPDKRRKK
jgi:hypothetical protein